MSALSDIKTNPLKKTLVSILLGSIFFAACKKDSIAPPRIIEESCMVQTANPAGKSYESDSIISYPCTGKFCGMLPVSAKNYWVYQDSIFNDGVFDHVQYDTLRFTASYKSVTDGLIWWECNMEIGLPGKLYVNDSAFFKLEDRMFTPGIVDAKKDYGLFPGDSLRYLASFEDAAAIGRSLRMQEAMVTPAGIFTEGLYFEKSARNYRRDQVYYKPGIGVIKYIQEKAPVGTRETRLQKVSTLVRYHFE